MKYLLTVVLIITSYTIFAQPNMVVSYSNKGVSFGAGYVSENGIAFNAAILGAIINSELPFMVSGSAGYEAMIGSVSITPFVGLSKHYYSDAGKSLGHTNKLEPIYTVEIGKDLHKGRIFLLGSYSGRTYYGAGMKIFITN